jgi:putative protease
VAGRDVESASEGDEALLWLGPDKAVSDVPSGRRVWKTSDPARERAVKNSIDERARRAPIDVRIAGAIGEAPVLEGRAAGAVARVTLDAPLEAARSAPLTESTLRDKLGRLGDTPFALGTLDVALPENVILPLSSLNRARRALVDALVAATGAQHHATTAVTASELLAAAEPPVRPPPAAGLFVLCRSLEQAHAALDAGATGVTLDFLELTGTGEAIRALRERPTRPHVTLAPPRIRKPGEEKIDRYLASLEPDAILVRGLGALRAPETRDVPRIGDFSLNVTNAITANLVLSHGLDAFTPSFDLDASQLAALLTPAWAPFAEVVVHHPMPLFHMEHCVIAALLSEGKDHKTCGRPCERHKVSLRDRAGLDHPVEADVGCRNTVFHAAAQSAAHVVTTLQARGVRRFRIELVREGADEVGRIVSAYRRLLSGEASAPEVWRTLRTLGMEGHYGVVRGSLRVLDSQVGGLG